MCGAHYVIVRSRTPLPRSYDDKSLTDLRRKKNLVLSHDSTVSSCSDFPLSPPPVGPRTPTSRGPSSPSSIQGTTVTGPYGIYNNRSSRCFGGIVSGSLSTGLRDRRLSGQGLGFVCVEVPPHFEIRDVSGTCVL